ncbi:hypothetical protein [Tabrizicola sp.]|uniref:hypothetical protein n=1 Tax=Tabrizicola sp. TaxID=2005166 RepID=UPI00286A3AF5|nr:hypothetical protein [Tabrizicola sp.]
MSSLAVAERVVRNLHPLDYDNGRISSSAFNPSASHGFKLSLDRLMLTSANDAYDRHKNSGLATVGVCGVLVEDFNFQSINCFEDKLPTNPAHCFADFSPFGTSDRKRKARELANKSALYGLDYVP